MSAGLPLGEVVDTTPAERPGNVRLAGRTCRIERLDPDRHADGLWQAMKDNDRLWAYMAYGPFTDGKAFANWLDDRAAMLDPLSYVIADWTSGATLGIATLLEIRPAMRVIEIGNLVFSPAMQRSVASTEAQYLFARHVFEDLGYRRYEWKCNAMNEPSRRAALRLGFTFEGIFRQHMMVKGRNRDTAWFAMLDSEWPGRKAAFERWLAPENFDKNGQQHLSLSALNAAGAGT